MDDWQNVLIRRAALDVSGSRYFHGQIACTSYDPQTHAIKGIILPHGIETGWIPLAAIMTSGGSGTGHFIGPTPGDASSLQNGGQFKGDVLDLHFDMGDPNSAVAKHRMSQPQNPPQVQSGEHLLQHEKGSSTIYKQDGSIVQTHFAKQGTVTWDASGNHTVDTKGATLTVMSSGGDMHINSGGGTLHIN